LGDDYDGGGGGDGVRVPGRWAAPPWRTRHGSSGLGQRDLPVINRAIDPLTRFLRGTRDREEPTGRKGPRKAGGDIVSTYAADRRVSRGQDSAPATYCQGHVLASPPSKLSNVSMISTCRSLSPSNNASRIPDGRRHTSYPSQNAAPHTCSLNHLQLGAQVRQCPVRTLPAPDQSQS